MAETKRNRQIALSIQNFMNLKDASGEPWNDVDDSMLSCFLEGLASLSPDGWCWLTDEGKAAHASPEIN